MMVLIVGGIIAVKLASVKIAVGALVFGFAEVAIELCIIYNLLSNRK